MDTQHTTQISTTRFGSVEVPDENLLHFKNGIIGFPKETRFTLIPHGQSTSIAWLQSAATPGLAFPVVSAHGLVGDYPDVPIEPLVDKAGIAGSGADEFAVLAVLCASQLQPATVNLLAPLLINAETRQGAQVFLEGSRFTTRELFVMPTAAPESETTEPRPAGAQAPLAPTG